MFPFKISEFCIQNYAVSQRVANMILEHIKEVLPFRLSTGIPLTASKRSGYRSFNYELSKHRSGLSQHTFTERKGKYGAVDWTCINKSKNPLLLEHLINDSGYTRIAYNEINGVIIYIHCDYKEVDKRQLFNYNSNGEWVFIKNI